MDQAQLETFMQVVFGNSTGLLAVGQISGSSGRDGRGVDLTSWFSWPEQAPEFYAWAQERADEDLYLSPMLYGQRRRVKENVTETPVIWADSDEADPDGYALQPSLSVETSPGRHHCYWVLTERVSPQWAEQMAQRVTYSRRDEGSDDGWALAKFLRVPGALNTAPKLEEPHRSTITLTGAIYTPQEMTKSFGEADVAVKFGLMDTPMPTDLPAYADTLDKVPPHPDIARLLNEAPRGRDYSEALFLLECELFRVGLMAPEVFVLCLTAPCNKFARDGRPEEALWKDVLKAEWSVTNEPGGPPKRGEQRTRERTHKKLVDKAVDQVGPIPRPEFITKAERATLLPTFIDRYVEWAQSKTNADARYHEFGAITLMSTVLSEFGHAIPKFGKLNLGLWFMILGQTTRTYKSTAKSLMLQVLNRVGNDDEFQYELGSDATSEGLLQLLAERPGRSGLLHRDEAQQMLADTKGGKSYMSGFAETLTELYDGRVRARIRATGPTKRTPAVDTQLVLYLMGVPGRVAEILNPNDFASGFLARFLYVIGTPAPATKDSMRLEQANLTSDRQTADNMISDLAQELLRARKAFRKITAPGVTVPIKVTAVAWDRFNEGIITMSEVAQKSDNPDLMEPTVDRMNKSVLKLTCLLAMMDGRTEANLHDVLTALSMAEGWYVSLNQMERMVGRSAFSAQVQDLVDFVGRQGGRVVYTTARKHFSGMTQREWQEVLNGAIDQGLVRTLTDTEGKWIEEMDL